MAQTPTLQTSDFRPSALDALKDIAERGGWANVTRYNLPYVEIHPAGTADRLKHLEASMSEDRAIDNTETPDFDQLQREDLAGFLAFNAYHQEHGDKQAAIRALAEAILKVQALP